MSQRFELRISNKYVAVQGVSIYYTWKNIGKQYKNNKLNIIALTLNDGLELPDDFYYMSDIQDYIEHINKKHETLTTTPPIHVYINRINNRLACKKSWI